MPGFQSTRLVTEGALEPFFFLYTDDSIQGNTETCKQSSIMLNYEVKNTVRSKTNIEVGAVCFNYSRTLSKSLAGLLFSAYGSRGPCKDHYHAYPYGHGGYGLLFIR